MKKITTFEEFVDGIQRAGWLDTQDAQHQRLRAFWERLQLSTSPSDNSLTLLHFNERLLDILSDWRFAAEGSDHFALAFVQERRDEVLELHRGVPREKQVKEKPTPAPAPAPHLPVNDGGPAFPGVAGANGCGNSVPTTLNGSVQYVEYNQGLSLRDWFAGQALANQNIEEHSGKKWADRVAEQAYRIADAMIAARNLPSS